MKLRSYLWALIFLPAISLAQGDEPAYPQIKIIGDGQIINCTSDPVSIGVAVEPWQQGFVYSWETGSTDSIISVRPNQTRAYDITVSNSEIGFFAIRSLEVKVFNAPIVTEDESILVDKSTCPGQDMHIAVDPTGGHMPFSYTWSNGSSLAAPMVRPSEKTIYTVTITDACGTTDEAEVVVDFEEHDVLIAPDPTDMAFTCLEDEITLEAPIQSASGGVGYGYVYTFDTWDNENQPLVAATEDDALFTYIISDACGIQEASSTIRLERDLPETPEVSVLEACKNEEVSITESSDALYFWDGQVMHTEYTASYDENSTVELIYIDECGEHQTIERSIRVQEVPTDFRMDVNHLDRTVVLEVPQELTENDDWTWYVNGVSLGPIRYAEYDLVTSDENEIVLEVETGEGCTEREARTVVLQDGVELPTAFSPNGDGLNDRFSVRFEDDLNQFDIKIFDRWGQLIYQSNDQYFEWDGAIDGQVSPLASYAYILKAETVSGRTIEKRGTVSTLIFD